MALKMVGPTMLGYRLPFPGDDQGRGATYRGAASLFWVLGDPRVVPSGHTPSARLAVLSDKEKKKLVADLADMLDRVAYYQRRFDDAVAVLIERKRQVGGTIAYDSFGSQLYDLLGFILTAARSFVDLITYVSARLAGKTEKEADKWNVEDLKRANTPEANILSRHGQWFDLLNGYRNALVHRGHRNSFGCYFSRHCNFKEANDPKYNVMLLPDYASIQRPNRSHQWTYKQGMRIEDLVTQIATGLEEFALEVGHGLDGSLPADSKIPYSEHFNILVRVQEPAFVFVDKIAIWAIFTKREMAEQFHSKMMNGTERAEPFEVHVCHQLEQPAFIFCLCPTSVEVLKKERIERVWLLRNPKPIYEEFRNFIINDMPISEYDASEVADDKIYLPVDFFPGIETLFMIRAIPGYL